MTAGRETVTSSGARRHALVTGAGSGIGRAIALALWRAGFDVWLTGRRGEALDQTAAMLPGASGRSRAVPCDLDDDGAVAGLADQVAGEASGRLAVLVHCAARYAMATIEQASVTEFDAIMHTNVRAVFVLTRHLLPAVRAARGTIVFLNSSAGRQAHAGVGVYAASKAALKAVADSLREEVRGDGIRVLSVYPGRTDTPMQKQVFEREGREYRPGNLLQPEDVAEAVLSAVLLPARAEVTDLQIRPAQRP